MWRRVKEKQRILEIVPVQESQCVLVVLFKINRFLYYDLCIINIQIFNVYFYEIRKLYFMRQTSQDRIVAVMMGNGREKMKDGVICLSVQIWIM